MGGYDPYTGYPYGEILEKIERNHVYKLFCRFTQKTAKFELNLTVCPWEYLPPQAEEVKGEVKMTNCYMVAPGGRVDIPTENVYKIWAQQAEFGNIPIPDGDVTAELVWQDEQGVIADGGITVINASEREKAYLQIRTAKEGNAVVAMKVNGEIYWSWHIWCTDYEPNVTEGQKFFNNLVWMDRNLGAMTNEYTIDGGVKGLFYQWGRKDPFPASEGWTDQEKMLYTLTGTTSLSYKEVDTSENLVAAIRQPARFFIAITSPGDWYTNSMSLLNRTLWLPNTKTIFDPCPVGWRVPGNQPWTGLLQGGLFNSYLNGLVHPDAGYFPCTGYRRPQTGRFDSLGNIVEWFAVASSSNECYGLIFQSVGVLRKEWSTYWRADGRSIRCVKE